MEKCVFQPYDEVFIFLSHPLPKWDCHLLKLWAPLLNDPNRLQPGSERGDWAHKRVALHLDLPCRKEGHALLSGREEALRGAERSGVQWENMGLAVLTLSLNKNDNWSGKGRKEREGEDGELRLKTASYSL